MHSAPIARIEATTAKSTHQPLSHIYVGRGYYYLVGQHLVHDRTRFLPSDITRGNLRPLRSAKKTLFEDDASDSDYDYNIYRRSRKSVISMFITCLINVYRVFNHLSVYRFSLSVASQIVRFRATHNRVLTPTLYVLLT